MYLHIINSCLAETTLLIHYEDRRLMIFLGIIAVYSDNWEYAVA
jgi:hypothetical protein